MTEILSIFYGIFITLFFVALFVGALCGIAYLGNVFYEKLREYISPFLAFGISTVTTIFFVAVYISMVFYYISKGAS